MEELVFERQAAAEYDRAFAHVTRYFMPFVLPEAQQALAVCENAEINFARTVVHAPVNGYVTNLVLDVGDYADAGKPVLAIVDQDSFRVEAYLEETKLNFVRVGDLAVVTPLSGAPPIKGEVDSIARGIGDTQNPTGSNLLQNVNATFEWVRLAQRIPVRIKLIDLLKTQSSLRA